MLIGHRLKYSSRVFTQAGGLNVNLITKIRVKTTSPGVEEHRIGRRREGTQSACGKKGCLLGFSVGTFVSVCQGQIFHIHSGPAGL